MRRHYLLMIGLAIFFFASWHPSISVAQANCPVTSVSLDTTNADGVVSGTVIGTGCDVIFEVKNERAYWVNIRATSVGNGIEVTPDDPQSVSLMDLAVIPPDGTVRFRVRFTFPGQTVTAILDVTPVTGDDARELNLIQAFLDFVSLLGIVDADFGTDFLLDYYPTLRNALSISPHLQEAALQLIGGNGLRFVQEMQAARTSGELTAFVNALGDIGADVSIEVLTDIVDDAFGGRYINALRIIWRNYRNAFLLLFNEPAGFVILTGIGSENNAEDSGFGSEFAGVYLVETAGLVELPLRTGLNENEYRNIPYHITAEASPVILITATGLDAERLTILCLTNCRGMRDLRDVSVEVSGDEITVRPQDALTNGEYCLMYLEFEIKIWGEMSSWCFEIASGAQNNMSCDGWAPALVSVNSRARFVSDPFIPMDVRASPNQSAPILGQLTTSDIFQIIGDSVCQDSLRWWPITYRGASAWIAGGDYYFNHWIEPID